MFATRAGADEETAELENVEYRITLALQEIDKNLAHANRVLTDRVLPAVRRHGGALLRLWDLVLFWKAFFEHSANVQLAGYEETVAVAPDAELDLEVSDSGVVEPSVEPSTETARGPTGPSDYSFLDTTDSVPVPVTRTDFTRPRPRDTSSPQRRGLPTHTDLVLLPPVPTTTLHTQGTTAYKVRMTPLPVRKPRDPYDSLPEVLPPQLLLDVRMLPVRILRPWELPTKTPREEKRRRGPTTPVLSRGLELAYEDSTTLDDEPTGLVLGPRLAPEGA